MPRKKNKSGNTFANEIECFLNKYNIVHALINKKKTFSIFVSLESTDEYYNSKPEFNTVYYITDLNQFVFIKHGEVVNSIKDAEKYEIVSVERFNWDTMGSDYLKIKLKRGNEVPVIYLYNIEFEDSDISRSAVVAEIIDD